MTDIYPYANGELGITDCVPLWASEEGQSRDFKGSYCFDVYATSQSKDQDFISSYYQHESGIVDYILFTDDAAFKQNDLENSYVKKRI